MDAKEKRQLYLKTYREQNKEKIKALKNKWKQNNKQRIRNLWAKRQKEITDSYVRQNLGIKKVDVTPEIQLLIETYKINLKIKRLCKTSQN
jgi:hypothetical protein